MTCWRPIGTAPKDGSWILGWCEHDQSPYRISWGRNHRGEMAWCTSFSAFVPGFVTHWIPQPGFEAREQATEPRRLALVWADDSGHPQLMTDDAALQVFSVDERVPDDRVYLLQNGIERRSAAEFDALIAGPVHRLGDKPVVEQAARALLDLKPNGKPSLSIVKPE